MKKKDPKWTLEQALEIVRDLQTKALHKGYHLALAGGVLNRGYSHNDLDIVALPLDNVPVKPRAELVELFRPYLGEVTTLKPAGSSVDRPDYVYRFDVEPGRVIDFLFYERKAA